MSSTDRYAMRRNPVDRGWRITWLVIKLTVTLGAGQTAGKAMSQGQEPVSVELDQRQVALGDQLSLSITVEGGSAKRPELPKINGVEISSSGQSNQYSLINGNMSSQTTYSYTLLPLKAGDYEIPPLKVDVDGKVHTTQAISFSVLPAGRRSAAPGNPPGSQSPPDPPDAGGRSADLFIERSFSAQKAYVNQPIIMFTRVYHRIPVYDQVHEFQPPPGVESFDIQNDRRYEETVDGERYRVWELRKILKPVQAGHFEIPPLKMKITYQSQRRRARDPFDLFSGLNAFNREARILITDSYQLDIAELPSGAPPHFTGLVGEFDATASLAKTDLQTGDSNTLSVVISGLGFVEGMESLQLSPLPQTVKVYPDKPSFSEDLTGGGDITSRAEFKFALIPLVPGEFNLPPLRFSTFSPERNEYVNHELELGKMIASGNAVTDTAPAGARGDGSAAASKPAEATPAGADLRGPGAGNQQMRLPWDEKLALRPIYLQGHLVWWLYASAAAGLGFWLGLCFRSSLGGGMRRLRSRLQPTARKRLLTELARLQKGSPNPAAAGDDWPGLAGELQKSLQEFVGNLTSGGRQALTFEELSETLQPMAVSEEQRDTLKRILRGVEAIRFGDGRMDRSTWSQQLTALADIIRGLR